MNETQEAQNKIAVIRDYIEDLLHSLPGELNDQIRILHKLLISVQAQFELAAMHQRQAESDLARLGETLVLLRTGTHRVTDVAQKLHLLSGLIAELNLSLHNAGEKILDRMGE